MFDTIWPFLAENTLLLGTGTPELDKMILEYYRLLKSLPLSHFTRPVLLLQVAVLQTRRRAFSGQKSDLDKAITHYTEAVLLSPTSSQDIVFALFHLATLLLVRYTEYNLPDGLKYSIKYLRFIRINFYSTETFKNLQPSGDVSSNLFRALALNLVLTPGEIEQDLEEMVTLIPEFITADILTLGRKLAIKVFGWAVTSLGIEIYCQENTQRAINRAIQLLREAAVLNPDLVISYAIAACLAVRFETTFVMKDCEEALTNIDRIFATCSPGDNLSEVERNATGLLFCLVVSRVNLSPTPENIEDGIHRLRTISPYSLDDEHRATLTLTLEAFTHKRFQYFGVTGNSGGTPPDPNMDILPTSNLGQRSGSETSSQIQEKKYRLRDFTIALMNGETTDVEAVVESSRKLIPSQQPSDQWSHSSDLADAFAGVLLHAYGRTERLDYLNEAITTFQGLRKISAKSKLSHFHVGCELHRSLRKRLDLLLSPQDFEELMQLSSELANDGSGEVFTRFEMSCFWAINAGANRRPSAFIAYETAMSLLQETLVLCPTLQTKHYRLSAMHRDAERLPSDYASYQIENGQVKQAIEILERGKALIWSEMRGFRTSTDQLRVADPAIADKFSDINKRLELVTMSVAQSDDIGPSETGTKRSIGHLVLTQRRLLEERNSLISHIQSLPGLEDFLRPLSFDVLNSAAACGPVIIINQARPAFPSSIIILFKDLHPSIITTPFSFHDRADQLEGELLRVRKKKGLDSSDYDLTLASVLSGLYELVGKPVIERLRELKVPKKSRVWWCPTSSFCSLPLHAMGPIPSDDGKDLYFSDLYIPSYTPTLSALIESRKRGSLSDASENSKPSILLVAQPDTLPGAFGEIKAIEATKTPVTTLISAMATPEAVIKGLRDHRFAHFVCHGILETGKPFDASLELHKDNLTLLAIVRSQLPAAEFAFLAACHTAELTEGSVSDEGLHLAAAMQYCGFRSVVGTLWAMADTDGADLSKHFYKAIFADRTDKGSAPYHERSARALQSAVKKLRKKRGMTLERWVNFVHYGA